MTHYKRTERHVQVRTPEGGGHAVPPTSSSPDASVTGEPSEPRGAAPEAPPAEATTPPEGATTVATLERLFAAYRQDQAAGVLDIRLAWADLPPDALSIAEEWAEAAREELANPDPVSLFGSVGYDWAFFVEAQNAIGFHQVLRAVLAHRGDPPASELMRRYAFDILRGRVHLSGAIRLVAGDPELLALLPSVFQVFLPGVDPASAPILAHAVRVAAAAALPRGDLYRLRGIQADEAGSSVAGVTGEASEDTPALREVRAEFARLMAEGEARARAADPAGQEALLVRALEVAAHSPEPDDDVEALGRILQLGQRIRLSTETVRRATAAIEMLVSRGHRSPAVAACFTDLVPLVLQASLASELGDALVTAGASLLEAELPRELRITLPTALYRVWLALGRSDQARALIAQVRSEGLSPADRLRLTVLEADTFEDKRDRGRAVDRLIEGLDRARDAGPKVRIPALQRLLALWPDNRDPAGLMPYVDELVASSARLREPHRTMSLVTAAVRLWKAGRRVQALRAWTAIDEERIRRETPPVLAERLLDAVAKARKKLDTSTAETVAY